MRKLYSWLKNMAGLQRNILSSCQCQREMAHADKTGLCDQGNTKFHAVILSLYYFIFIAFVTKYMKKMYNASNRPNSKSVNLNIFTVCLSCLTERRIISIRQYITICLWEWFNLPWYIRSACIANFKSASGYLNH